LLSVVNYLALLGVILLIVSYVYIIPWKQAQEEEEERMLKKDELSSATDEEEFP
jgi:hypothetical protein